MARLLALAGAATLALAVAGCGSETAVSEGTDKSATPTAATDTRVPDGAIAVGDDVYMVPLGKDAQGCAMYRAFSPTKAVAQVLQYRAADGQFVMNKDEAACSD